MPQRFSRGPGLHRIRMQACRRDGCIVVAMFIHAAEPKMFPIRHTACPLPFFSNALRAWRHNWLGLKVEPRMKKSPQAAMESDLIWRNSHQ